MMCAIFFFFLNFNFVGWVLTNEIWVWSDSLVLILGEVEFFFNFLFTDFFIIILILKKKEKKEQ